MIFDTLINEIGLCSKGWYTEHGSTEPRNEYDDLKKVIGTMCAIEPSYVDKEAVFECVYDTLQYLMNKRNPNGDSRCMNTVFKDVFFRIPLFPNASEEARPVHEKFLREMLGEIRQFKCQYFPNPTMPLNEKILALFPPLPDHMVKLQEEWKSIKTISQEVQVVEKHLNAKGIVPCAQQF